MISAVVFLPLVKSVDLDSVTRPAGAYGAVVAVSAWC